MFSKKDKDYSSVINQVTIIGKDVQFLGDLKTKDDIRIEGNVTGCIISESRVIIGQGAHIFGSVEGEGIDVLGVVIGDVKSKSYVKIGPNAVIEGDVNTRIIEIESGAKVYGYFNALGEKDEALRKKGPQDGLSSLSIGGKNKEFGNHNNSSVLLDVISKKVYQISPQSKDSVNSEVVDDDNDRNEFW